MKVFISSPKPSFHRHLKWRSNDDQMTAFFSFRQSSFHRHLKWRSTDGLFFFSKTVISPLFEMRVEWWWNTSFLWLLFLMVVALCNKKKPCQNIKWQLKRRFWRRNKDRHLIVIPNNDLKWRCCDGLCCWAKREQFIYYRLHTCVLLMDNKMTSLSLHFFFPFFSLCSHFFDHFLSKIYRAFIEQNSAKFQGLIA